MAIKTVLLNEEYVTVQSGNDYWINLVIDEINPEDQVKSSVKDQTKSGEFKQKIGDAVAVKGTSEDVSVTVPVAFSSNSGKITIGGTGFPDDVQRIKPYATYSHVTFLKTVHYT